MKDARTFLGELRSFEDSTLKLYFCEGDEDLLYPVTRFEDVDGTLTLSGGKPLRVGVASWATFQKSEAVQLRESVAHVSAISETHAVYLSAVPARRYKLGLVAKGFVEEKPIAVLYPDETNFWDR